MSTRKITKWTVVQTPLFSPAYIMMARGKTQAVLRTRRQACLLLSAPAFMKASAQALELLAEMGEHKNKHHVMTEISRAMKCYRHTCMRNGGIFSE